MTRSKLRVLLAAVAVVSSVTVGTGPAQAQIPCDGNPAPVEGTNGDDFLFGSGGVDFINGLAGDDVIYGGQFAFPAPSSGAGADHLCGGSGDDTVSGGADNDRLFGDSGDDTLNGGDNADQLFGGSGTDILNGNGGTDEGQGDSGDDACNVETPDPLSCP